ncbi:hypothetical protein COY95_04380, partial [Candidatus Woesearchaeota archaeon CG_4_10_14_0_8_um_filter_47_5]
METIVVLFCIALSAVALFGGCTQPSPETNTTATGPLENGTSGSMVPPVPDRAGGASDGNTAASSLLPPGPAQDTSAELRIDCNKGQDGLCLAAGDTDRGWKTGFVQESYLREFNALTDTNDTGTEEMRIVYKHEAINGNDLSPSALNTAAKLASRVIQDLVSSSEKLNTKTQSHPEVKE